MKSFFKISIITIALAIGFFYARHDLKNNIMEGNAVLIDVRTHDEYKNGYLNGAVNVPLDDIETKITDIIPDKTTPVYVYCRSGRRSGIAEEKLKKMGYTAIHNMGGFKNAKDKLNLSVVKTTE